MAGAYGRPNIKILLKHGPISGTLHARCECIHNPAIGMHAQQPSIWKDSLARHVPSEHQNIGLQGPYPVSSVLQSPASATAKPEPSRQKPGRVWPKLSWGREIGPAWVLESLSPEAVALECFADKVCGCGCAWYLPYENSFSWSGYWTSP